MTKKRNESSSGLDSITERFDMIAARRALLTWFEKNGRVFPWRENPTPYRVWISEIMLQQTTTQTVVGYFDRFLARFPDVSALANADESDVLKLWEGLGYYRRAKALRQAARVIVERFDGVFPDKYDDVIALPGIGEYAVGAILSFGFDKRAPILEANTTRLCARLIALLEETTKASARRRLWDFADAWLPKESSRRALGLYRRINSALTDLGRLVCVPTAPRCDDCPLANFCEARRLGLQDVAPVLRKRTETIERVDAAFWIARGDLTNASGKNATDVLLTRRPEGELWAGLWDFPRFETELADEKSSIDVPILRDRLQYFLEEKVGAAPFDYRPGTVLTTLRHSVTKYRVTLRLCRLKGADPTLGGKNRTLFDCEDERIILPKREQIEPKEIASIDGFTWRWTPIEELDATPLSSPGRKIAQFISKTLKDRRG